MGRRRAVCWKWREKNLSIRERCVRALQRKKRGMTRSASHNYGSRSIFGSLIYAVRLRPFDRIRANGITNRASREFVGKEGGVTSTENLEIRIRSRVDAFDHAYAVLVYLIPPTQTPAASPLAATPPSHPPAQSPAGSSEYAGSVHKQAAPPPVDYPPGGPG